MEELREGPEALKRKIKKKRAMKHMPEGKETEQLPKNQPY